MYSVKEIFYTIQGEGAHAGKAAVFCRFTGCNLWSGLEKDRSTAVCQFCDTDFVGTNGKNGGKFVYARDLAIVINNLWGGENDHKMVVFTGGEPLLQLDQPLVAELKKLGFYIAVETNGTVEPNFNYVDWICVSPKAGSKLKIIEGDEIKVVYPQTGVSMDFYETLNFKRFSVQPKDGFNKEKNIKDTVSFVLSNPKWVISFQIHKVLGVD